MFKDILVIVMAALALIVGVSAWWHENHNSKKDDSSVPDEPDTVDTK